VAPTSSPTSSPTSAPTLAPTAAPTSNPTSAPTTAPTLAPTPTPTTAPTSTPAPATASAPTISQAPSSAPTTFDEFCSQFTGGLSNCQGARCAFITTNSCRDPDLTSCEEFTGQSACNGNNKECNFINGGVGCVTPSSSPSSNPTLSLTPPL